MKEVIPLVRKIKADRLISISCVKQEGGFALYYHLSKGENIEELKVEAGDGEEVESVSPLFPSAAVFETEAEELYGVKFKGNPMGGKRLFLEER